jgi:serine/threonine protein phosphatase PrpC
MTGGGMTCPSCGAVLVDNDRFCEGCGARVSHSGDDERVHAEIDLGIVAGVTDRGLHHTRNEDAFFLSNLQDKAVVVICDGVSSSSESHTAAQLAADVAGRVLVDAVHARFDADAAPWDPSSVTVEAIEAAQSAVEEISVENVDDPPACTLVSALWDGHELTFGWVGDSRAYWIGATDAHRVTIDDAWNDTHMLTRWIGVDAPPGPPGVTRFTPKSPGHVVVCSDGFWNYTARAEEIAALVDPGPRATVLDLAQRLTRIALAAGGHDNITVAVMAIPAEDAAGSDVRRDDS